MKKIKMKSLISNALSIITIGGSFAGSDLTMGKSNIDSNRNNTNLVAASSPQGIRSITPRLAVLLNLHINLDNINRMLLNKLNKNENLRAEELILCLSNILCNRVTSTGFNDLDKRLITVLRKSIANLLNVIYHKADTNEEYIVFVNNLLRYIKQTYGAQYISLHLDNMIVLNDGLHNPLNTLRYGEHRLCFCIFYLVSFSYLVKRESLEAQNINVERFFRDKINCFINGTGFESLL